MKPDVGNLSDMNSQVSIALLMTFADRMFQDWMDCRGFGDDDEVMILTHKLVKRFAVLSPVARGLAEEHSWSVDDEVTFP